MAYLCLHSRNSRNVVKVRERLWVHLKVNKINTSFCDIISDVSRYFIARANATVGNRIKYLVHMFKTLLLALMAKVNTIQAVDSICCYRL